MEKVRQNWFITLSCDSFVCVNVDKSLNVPKLPCSNLENAMDHNSYLIELIRE